MAEPLPAALKTPEVSRFVNRANQLRTFKPAIAYWCEYHAVNQIVGKGLHNGDDAAFDYTKTLIERLEATKAERPDDDAIHDEVAGQAYVEQFAGETFARAERTMEANKVTRQTADTFDAAATFFDLTREWGDPSPETLQKIKFAKWNAARILKAIREGRDPNESNPKPQPQQDEPPVTEDELDAETNALAAQVAAESAGQQQQQQPPPQHAAVEEVPDGGEPSAAAAVEAPPEEYFPVTSAPPPIPEPESEPEPLNRGPVTGVPEIHSHNPAFSPSTPSAPVISQPPPPSSSGAPTPSWTTGGAPHIPTSASSYPPPPQPPPVVQHPVPVATTNQRDLNQAQKHAKFAISALNFDDVPTAINELRSALAMLGAQ